MSERHAPRFPAARIGLVVAHDLLMAAAAFEIAVWARYYTYGAPQDLFFLWEGTIVFTAVSALIFAWSGLFRGIWHYASMTDLFAITRAVTIAVLVFVPVMFTVSRLEAFPRSALIFVWPLLIVMLGGPRLLYRLFKDGNLNAVFERTSDPRVPVLLAGAGDAAELFIREMTRPRSPYRVVGLVDDRARRIGRNIRGVRIWGSLDDLPSVVEGLAKRGRRPQRLIVASDRFSAAEVKALVETAQGLGMTLARLPKLTDFRDDQAGRVALHGRGMSLRAVAVEDLLGRPQQTLDRDAMRKLVHGRRVLVTGAGGTIGSEIVRQVAAFGPAKLVLFDSNEYALYLIDLELGESHADLPRAAILGDVRDPARLDSVFAAERPELVFHAAALKHVPLAEANPIEAVQTNALGTRNVARACVNHRVDRMVMISTDKAVNPSSIMGATKRVAESFAQALSLDAAVASRSETRFVTVRFGNVLGSTGSVVPLFQRQIAAGGPITVTHPDITRFFMTVKEAVELVLQASALPEDPAAAGTIFVLDMGEAVRIQDLARQMIRLAGLRPDHDIQIVYTGLRPGEKLYEEVFHAGETLVPTPQPGIQRAAPRVADLAVLDRALDQLATAAARGDGAEIRRQLQLLVPEYAAPDHPPLRTAPV